MSRRLVASVIALSALLAEVAGASEQSKRLYSKGLVDFHAGRQADALKLFEAAVTADPTDVYARYYRALARGALNDLPGAITDLRAVLAERPDFDDAALELGIALVQSGAYQEAQPWLEQAQRRADLDAQASLFLGLSELRRGDLGAARANFERAGIKSPERKLAAEYYLGVTDYQEGKFRSAAQHFTAVMQESPGSAMGHEASEFLVNISQVEPPPYLLYGAVGFQYDTNVVVAPSDNALKTQFGISHQSDGRAVINAGAIVSPWQTDRAELSLGYDFYQSLHFELHQFNIEDHRPSVQLLLHTDPVQFGILGQYNYYFLETDSFLQEGIALPWIAIPLGRVGRTEFFYRMRRRDFFTQVFRIRDAFNHAVGVQQFFYLDTPNHYVHVGYQFDRDDPIHNDVTSKEFAYNGNQIDTGITWTFPWDISTDGGYSFRHERYDDESAVSNNGTIRRDDEHQFIFTITKRLTEHLDLTTGYFATINNSNDKSFDYDRQIGSLSLEARF